MAVPAGIPVEQSISEIDAEIRMEDIRQSPAARLKMEHFHAAIKKNLMDKKLNYEAEHRKEILEGLKHMKRRLPAESGASLVKKLESLAVNLDCFYQNEGEIFLMKNEDLNLSVTHKNEQAISVRINYFGIDVPNDNEITQRINNNEWDDLRIAIRSMVRTVPTLAPKDIRKQLYRYRLSLEERLGRKWGERKTATISEINESSVGWPSPPTTLRPLRVFLYGEPGVEFEMKEKGINSVDPEKGEVPFGEIVIVDSEKENVFSYEGTSFSYPGVIKLELSAVWLLSAYTVEQLNKIGARPASILQKTSLIRLIANCQMKEGDIELSGNELGKDVRYLLMEEGNEKDLIVDGLLIENAEKLEAVLLLLHQQAVFNSSWESIVASCCGQDPLASSQSIQFEMNTRGCNWEIVFTGDGVVYHVHLNPSTTRHWNLKIFSSNDAKVKVEKEIESAFNRTWSLSKCLSHLLTLLNISGYEWKLDAVVDASLPPSECSLEFESKVSTAWLRKEAPSLPPPAKHQYQVDLPKGRCPLLSTMRDVKRRKPLKVARPRPQLSNPTVPPLRVNLLQSHTSQTPFNHIENMVNRVEDGRSTGSPMGSMEGGQLPSSVYGHPQYSAQGMGGHRMVLPPGTSPLVRGGMNTMGGMNPAMPPYGIPPQQEMMRQQFMRQQSNASLGSGVFDFPDESGSSPSSVQDFSPGYGSQYGGYAPPQSPLVRGGATTKTRRPRGRKAGNVGDRTPSSSIDSQSPSPFSPETKRPKSGPGSRGGRGSRGKRGISMDQSMSPFQRSISEMSNSMSSPLAASVTPLYSQSFDDGTSDDECDPPPFSRSLTSSIPSTSSSTVVAPSRLSSSSFTISSSPLANPPVSQPLPSTPIISVVPSPLVPSPIIPSPLVQSPMVQSSLVPPPSSIPSSTPTLSSVLSAPSSLPHSLTPSILTSIPTTIPQSLPSSITHSIPQPLLQSNPSTSSSSPHPSAPQPINPSLVRRKSSLESIVSGLSASQQTKKKNASGPASDLFDTGLDDSSPQPSSNLAAPLLYSETKMESPKKEGGDERVVLKLKKTAKESKKKDKSAEKEKDKEKRKEDKPPKSGEEKDRKRKGDSSSKERKDKESKKAKLDPPLIGGGTESFVPMPKLLQNFKIPKTGTKGPPGELSIPSSSSSMAAPLPSPSLVKPTLSTPSSSFQSQPKGGPSQSREGPSLPYRPPHGSGARQPPLQQHRPTKSILKSSGPSGPPPPPPPGPSGRHFPPERKVSHPPYNEPPRTRQPSGGFPPHPSSLPPQNIRRPPLNPKSIPPHQMGWNGRARSSHPHPDGPPTLTPAISAGPSQSIRQDRPPTLESNQAYPSRPIIEDSPASPDEDTLRIVDD